jgi:pre-rRNA-processing protein IPI1
MPEGMTTSTSDFKADQLQALLPSIWGLLNSLPSDEQMELFEAFLAYYNRLAANSQSKHIALGFLTRVYMVCAHCIVGCSPFVLRYLHPSI